jgi:Arc/MetJ-type ribon-helix-helix transcriptional regulator
MNNLEKLTINLSPVDVGQIELLVAQGFYANRAEFIRVAIHNQLARHSETVRDTTTRRSMVIGALTYDRASLERTQQAKVRLVVRVVGLLVIADDVTPTLARAVIDNVSVYGVFKASPEVKKALADRMAE